MQSLKNYVVVPNPDLSSQLIVFLHLTLNEIYDWHCSIEDRRDFVIEVINLMLEDLYLLLHTFKLIRYQLRSMIMTLLGT